MLWIEFKAFCIRHQKLFKRIQNGCGGILIMVLINMLLIDHISGLGQVKSPYTIILFTLFATSTFGISVFGYLTNMIRIDEFDRRLLCSRLKNKYPECNQYIDKIIEVAKRTCISFSFKEYDIRTMIVDENSCDFEPDLCNVYKNGNKIKPISFSVYSTNWVTETIYLREFFYHAITSNQDKQELERVLYQII